MDHDTLLELKRLDAVLTDLTIDIENSPNFDDSQWEESEALIKAFQVNLMKVLNREPNKD